MDHNAQRRAAALWPKYLLAFLLAGLLGLPRDTVHADGVTFHWVATWGGPAAAGTLYQPAGLALDAAGNVYVSDTGNHRIQVFDSGGAFLRTIGAPGRGDGEFYGPAGIAVQGDLLYVADERNTRIQVLTTEGAFVRRVGSYSASDPGGLQRPSQVGADAAGKVVIWDWSRVAVLRFGAGGVFEGSDPDCEGQLAGAADAYYCVGRNTSSLVYRVAADGTRTAATPLSGQPDAPLSVRALAPAPDGTLWVYDAGRGDVARHYDSTGAQMGSFPIEPGAVALAAANDRLLVLTQAPQVTTYSLSGARLAAWGTGSAYTFDHPNRLAAAPDGTLYVLESGTHRVLQLGPDGHVLAALGSGAAKGNLTDPRAIAVDAVGRLYVTDESPQQRVVRFASDRFDATGEIWLNHSIQRNTALIAAAAVSDTLLMMNTYGRVLASDLDGVTMAEWYRMGDPMDGGSADLAVTAAGRVYLATNTSYFGYVQARTTTGTKLFTWGTTASGDNPPPGAFTNPRAIAADQRGRIFVLDGDNRSPAMGGAPAYGSRVQVFDEAGSFLGAWGGFGAGQGQFVEPSAIAALPDGRIVVADLGTNRLQIFAPDGPLPPATPLPLPPSYTAGETTPINWQSMPLAGAAAPSALALPPAGVGGGPAFAVYGPGQVALSSDLAGWSARPPRLPDPDKRLSNITYAGSSTLIGKAWAAAYRSDDLGLTWTRLGDAFNGFQANIAASPGFDQDGTLYAAAYDSGFWRSTDRGASWQLLGLAGHHVQSLAVATAAGGSNVLMLSDASAPAGMLRSIDGGVTWQFIGGPHPGDVTFSPAFFEDQTAFGLADAGLLRSTDGGQSWSRRSEASLPSLWDGRLTLSPNFAADGTMAAYDRYNAYLSTDAGQSWVLLAASGPRLLLVAFAPDYATSHRIFRSMDGTGGFGCSTDAGQTWQPVAPGLPTAPAYGLARPGERLWQASYYGIAEVAAGGAWRWLQTLTNLGAGSSRPAMAALSPAFAADGTALLYGFVTRDGGASWLQPAKLKEAMDQARGSSVAFAPDFAASQTIVAATDQWEYQSVVRSTDGGATWTALWTWEGVPYPPAALSFDAAWPATARLYLGGEGGVAVSTDTGSNWTRLEGSLTGLDVVALVSRLEAGQSVLYAATTTRGAWRSADGGLSWLPFSDGLPNGHLCTLAANGSLLAAAGCDGQVYVRANAEAGWTRLLPLLPARPAGLLIEGMAQTRTIWAATAGGIFGAAYPGSPLPPRAWLPRVAR